MDAAFPFPGRPPRPCAEAVEVSKGVRGGLGRSGGPLLALRQPIRILRAWFHQCWRVYGRGEGGSAAHRFIASGHAFLDGLPWGNDIANSKQMQPGVTHAVERRTGQERCAENLQTIPVPPLTAPALCKQVTTQSWLSCRSRTRPRSGNTAPRGDSRNSWTRNGGKLHPAPRTARCARPPCSERAQRE